MEMTAAMFAAAPTALTAAETSAAVASAGPGAASWAAGTTVQAAGGASGALSVLQGMSTATSVLASLAGGGQAYLKGQQDKRMSELQGRQAEIEAQDRANRIDREHLQRAAANRVAFAASGLEIGTGSAAAIEDSLGSQAAYETAIERRSGRMRSIFARMRGQAAAGEGEAGLAAGALKGLNTLANYKLDIARRG